MNMLVRVQPLEPMKYFEVVGRLRHWGFRCKEDRCDQCGMKFFCVTNGKVAYIYDDVLVRRLIGVNSDPYSYYEQGKAREVFFRYMRFNYPRGE